MELIRRDAGVLRKVLALGLTGFGLLEVWRWMPDPDEPREPIGDLSRLTVALAVAACTLSVALPPRARLATLATALPASWLAFGGLLDTSIALVLAVGAGIFLAAAEAATVRGLAIAASGAAATVATDAIGHPDAVAEVGDLLFLVAALAAAWAAGAAIRVRRQRESQLAARASELEAARDVEVAAATVEERARIARELHDVVAHAISVIVIQARGGRRSVGRDPAGATASFQTIESTATAALAEMRRLVDVLRPASEPGALEPQPSLAHLDALLASVRDAGLPVEIQVEGRPTPLPPGVDLAAYRVVQEALTNALRHASAAMARVIVRYGAAAVEVEIRDDGIGAAAGPGRPSRTSGPGRGTIGMRERTALYGGSLEVGPSDGGGWFVVARLPYDAGAA